MWQIDAGSSLLHITGSCFFPPSPKYDIHHVVCIEHIRLASKPAGFSNITKKDLQVSPSPKSNSQIKPFNQREILKSWIPSELERRHALPTTFSTDVRPRWGCFLRFKPYEVTNMLWAYAKLKEWNAQLFRCGNPRWLVGGWWLVSKMDGKISGMCMDGKICYGRCWCGVLQYEFEDYAWFWGFWWHIGLESMLRWHRWCM